MSHPNKARGTRWESAVVDYLKENGYPQAERRALHGTQDMGDIINGPDGWVLEAKDEQTLHFAQYLKEAEAEAGNAGADWFAAVVKARGKSVAKAYAILPLWELVKLIRKAEQ